MIIGSLSGVRLELCVCVCSSSNMKSSAAFMFYLGSAGTTVQLMMIHSWYIVPFSLVDPVPHIACKYMYM